MKKILKIFYNFPKLFLRNYILFESNPDFSDNTYAVYKEIIKRNINKKFKCIWFTNSDKKIKEENVIIIRNKKNILNKIRRFYYMVTAKYIIDCNNYIRKLNKHQFRIHLTHGAFIKLPYDYCSKCGEVDCLTQISDFFTDINSELFKVTKEKIYTTGFPRNDIIINNKSMPSVIKETRTNKIILWMPTYRNHSVSKSEIYRTGKNFKYGIPCIKEKKELTTLNKELQDNNILLLLKLHPEEDTSKINEVELSNIIMLDKKENVYNYFAFIDALITDYSSVYYDFMITKKMIGLAIPDIEEYSKKTKLITNDYESFIIGEYIKNYNDLISFVKNVATSNDITYDERMKKLKLYNKYVDGNSSKRVVDILEKRMRGEYIGKKK